MKVQDSLIFICQAHPVTYENAERLQTRQALDKDKIQRSLFRYDATKSHCLFLVFITDSAQTILQYKNIQTRS